MKTTCAIKRGIAYGAITAAALSAILLFAGCAQTGDSDKDSSSPAIETSTSVVTGGGSELLHPTEEYGALTRASYSDSGNSLGNLYSIETGIDEDGVPIVREFESPSHDVRATIREYRAPEDLLDRIAAIANDAGMKEWGDLPMSDMVPLDASTPMVTLTYAYANPDEDFPIWLSFTAWDVFPDGGEEAFDAIRDELQACIVDDNLIREYEEPNFER